MGATDTVESTWVDVWLADGDIIGCRYSPFLCRSLERNLVRWWWPFRVLRLPRLDGEVALVRGWHVVGFAVSSPASRERRRAFDAAQDEGGACR